LRPQPTPLFDFGHPVQVTTLAGITCTGREVDHCSAPWDEVFGTVREARTKTEAHSVVCATYRPGPVRWAGGGRPGSGGSVPRPSSRAIDSVTALVYDFDTQDWGSVDGSAIEGALMQLGLAGTFWSTWSSTVVRPRWRLAIPLSHPITPAAYREIWPRVGGAVADEIHALMLLDPEQRVSIDLAAGGIGQPAILPVRPPAGGETKAMSRAAYPWGGVVPAPVHVDGVAVVPEQAQAATSATHYTNSLRFVQRTGRGWGGARKGVTSARGAPIVPAPYVGVPDAPDAAQTAATWAADERTAVALTAGMDAVARVRRDGLGRVRHGSVLRAACWHQYRCGILADEISRWGSEALAATPGVSSSTVRELVRQVEYFRRKQDAALTDPWTDRAVTAILTPRVDPETGKPRPVPTPEQQTAVAQVVLILACASHLDPEGGGSLSWAQIALVVGMPAVAGVDRTHAAVVAWRSALVEAGLLSRSGERQATTWARRVAHG
jgi:hypothetical protein